MRSVNITLATLEIDGLDLPLLSADLVAVRRESGELDWEVVAMSLPVTALHQSTRHLVMTGFPDGRSLTGDAIVVRSDEQRHVFRGSGPLDGLVSDDGLHDPEG